MKYSAKENVLYLDNHLLALYKPASMLTQPARDGLVNLEDLAKAYLKEHFQKAGNVFLHPIHRLDKDVKGIVLFARTSKALSRLQKDMREKKISRSYFATVEGFVDQDEQILEHHLVHGSFKARLASKDEEGAKKAVLSYQVVERGKDRTHLKVNLHTGRYHQIRAQLSFIGHPIIGDKKYGSSIVESIQLEHSKMEFTHPVSKQPCILTV